MSLQDYIIDHRDIDWPPVLKEWSWLLPRKFNVWLMNRYGDLFIELDDGPIHMLDISGGTFEKVAASREDFATLIDEGDNANQWLMIPLIDRLVEAGRLLKDGQCYSYIRPPLVGGDYTVENTSIVPIAEHFGVYASIHQQLKDVPDGTEVVIETINMPRSSKTN